MIYGDTSAPWPDLSLGTADAVFIEDNYFYDNRHGVASNQGSRYVFRYNDMLTTDRTRNFGMIDAHDRGSYPPGSRSWEIYNNTLQTESPELSATAMGTRGGDGVIFDNVIGESFPYIVHLRDESGCTGEYPALNQIREAYIWNNTWDGPVKVNESCTDFIREGRDYFLTPRPGYVPYTYPHPLR